MIQTHSDDPDVTQAAEQAQQIIVNALSMLPRSDTFDYGGHLLKVGEYGVCERCTTSIAEAQAAEQAIRTAIERANDPLVKEHLELAAQLFRVEAEAATLRAELHNGHSTENILNTILSFQYERRIGDEYNHSHHGGIE